MQQEPIGELDHEKLRIGGAGTRFRMGRMGAKKLVLLLRVVVLLSVALVGCVPTTPEVIESTVEVTRIVDRVVTPTLIPSTPTLVPTAVMPTATPRPTQTSVPPALEPTALPTPTERPRVTLVKGPGEPVYLIIEGLERRWFPNSQAFEAFTHEYGLGWDDIKTHQEYPELWRQTCRLPCGEPMPFYYLIPKGTLMQAAESPDIYQIATEEREGIKLQVKVLVSGEVDEDEVACVSQGWLDSLSIGSQ